MVTNVNNSKSSVQKGIRNQLLEQFPNIDNYLDDIVPKKESLKIVKWYAFTELDYDNFIHFFKSSS